MAYKARVRSFKPIGKGEYFTQSKSVSHWLFIKILILPFKLTWWIFKYTIGLPFVILYKKFKKK